MKSKYLKKIYPLIKDLLYIFALPFFLYFLFVFLYQFLHSQFHKINTIKINIKPKFKVKTTPIKFSQNQNELIQEFSLKYIKSGTFIMGSPSYEYNRMNDEGPQKKITISKDFYISQYELSQKLWHKYMGTNPSFFINDQFPVDSVSWEMVRSFIKILNVKYKCKTPDALSLIDKNGLSIINKGCFRLPTEAEWEYVARANIKGAYAKNKTSQKSFLLKRTKNIGTYQANNFGLHDLHGNVWEWVQDGYHIDFYKSSLLIDPVNNINLKKRVIRGGNWKYNNSMLRTAQRNYNTPDYKYFFLGFRLVYVI